MNRRGFFGLLGAAAATAIALPELELLVPKRTIFLPPAGGWIGHGNQLFTLRAITGEMLKALEANLMFAGEIDHAYERAFLSGSQWTPAEMSRAIIRRPPRYDIAVGDRITIAGVVPRGTNYRGGA